jgi:hypothetical protein
VSGNTADVTTGSSVGTETTLGRDRPEMAAEFGDWNENAFETKTEETTPKTIRPITRLWMKGRRWFLAWARARARGGEFQKAGPGPAARGSGV